MRHSLTSVGTEFQSASAEILPYVLICTRVKIKNKKGWPKIYLNSKSFAGTTFALEYEYRDWKCHKNEGHRYNIEQFLKKNNYEMNSKTNVLNTIQKVEDIIWNTTKTTLC